MEKIQIHANGLEYLEIPLFRDFPGVKAIFTTRRGGVSEGCYESLNFSFTSGDDLDLVNENYRLLAEALGTSTDKMARTDQKHTTNVRVVGPEDAGKGVILSADYQAVDGLVTNVKGLTLITQHADCNPVYLYDPVAAAIGMVHSGWKGTLGNITGEAIQRMEETYGCRPENLYLATGPALCQDCFQVDLDLAQDFRKADAAYDPWIREPGDGKAYIDLKAILRYQGLAAGISAEHIELSPWCTRCHPDIFFSHRVMGPKRGLMVACLELLED